MHIPDGYLGPVTSTVLYAAMVPVWAAASRRVHATLESGEAPAVALAGAFSFVIMMFNVPAPGGTTGHAVGAAVAAIVLGPSAAILAVSVALAIQALLFGDGGILAFGANALNMAGIMPISAYAVFHALAPPKASPGRTAFAAGAAGYVSLNLAALAAAVQLGLQPALEPGHCPYGLTTALSGMLIPHLLFLCAIEAAVTAGVVAHLSRGGAARLLPPSPARRPLWIALGVLCLASPLGLLAAGTAWGEWGPDELERRSGTLPAGLEAWSGWWTPVVPDYDHPALGSPAGAYLLSAVVGVALTAGVVALVARFLARRQGGRSDAPSPMAGR